MNLSPKKGISLIEIIISIAILAIILTIVLPELGKMRENQTLQSAVADVESVINRARSQTLSSIGSSEYGVHFETDRVIIFTGTVYSQIDPANEVVEIISPAEISNISLGGGEDVYFERLSGYPSATGTLTVSSPNFTKTITLSPTGLVSTN